MRGLVSCRPFSEQLLPVQVCRAVGLSVEESKSKCAFRLQLSREEVAYFNAQICFPTINILGLNGEGKV